MTWIDRENNFVPPSIMPDRLETTDKTETRGRLQDKMVNLAARLVLGMLIISGATGAGIKMYEVGSDDQADYDTTIVAQEWVNLRLSATGGYANDTTAYDSACLENPLESISTTATASILSVNLYVKNNPSTAKITAGFVDDCGGEGKTTSGAHVFNRVGQGNGSSNALEQSSGSGNLIFTGGTLPIAWPPSSYSGSKLKFTVTGTTNDGGVNGFVAAGFDARARIRYEQAYE